MAPAGNVATPRWAIVLLLSRRLPKEVAEYIADCVFAMPEQHQPSQQLLPHRHPALAPPSDGSSPFMSLPTELRRAVFAESLPPVHMVIQPKCGCDNDEETEKTLKKIWGDELPPPKHNRASDLMTINKKITKEIAYVVYEERYFAIHVHQGIINGGIEFLNTGRQPLQYQDDVTDSRFARFKVGGDFNFDRLKKIHITIYPPESDATFRHVVLNTYFMNIALCRLLERSGGQKNRITSLTINFASQGASNAQQLTGRRAILSRESQWWDPDTDQPRETSIHRLSDIELVLRPFATLSGCHSVTVNLPAKLAQHPKTCQFVQDLVGHMKSTDVMAMGFVDDRVDQQIEAARAALEDHIMHVLYGTSDKFKVENITDKELDYGYTIDETDGYDKKHELSPNRGDSEPKRRRSQREHNIDKELAGLGLLFDDDEDEFLQRALLESAFAASVAEQTGAVLERHDSAREVDPQMDLSAFMPFNPSMSGAGLTAGNNTADSIFGSSWVDVAGSTLAQRNVDRIAPGSLTSTSVAPGEEYDEGYMHGGTAFSNHLGAGVVPRAVSDSPSNTPSSTQRNPAALNTSSQVSYSTQDRYTQTTSESTETGEDEESLGKLCAMLDSKGKSQGPASPES